MASVASYLQKVNDRCIFRLFINLDFITCLERNFLVLFLELPLM